MTSLWKIINLLKEYPWGDFGGSLLMIAMIAMTISLFKYKKARIWLKKVTLTIESGFSGILFILSVIAVNFCTFFFYTWIVRVYLFNPIENYLITIFLMFFFSLLFGTISFLIHLSNTASFKIDNINKHNFYLTSKIHKLDKLHSLQSESKLLKSFLKLMEDNISLNFLGYVKGWTQEKLRGAINNNSFEMKKYASEVYQINDLDLYYIEIQASGPYGSYPTNYLLNESDFVSIDNHLISTYPGIYFSLNDAVSQKDKKPKEYQKIMKIVLAQIDYVDNIMIPAYQDFISGNYIKVQVFLYAFLLEIFGLRQSYIIPLNTVAKVNHLFFGIYRFLMQGTFIGLLIKNLANL